MIRIRHGRTVASRANVRGGAFTLIELLVAVSIIALLISILVPSLQGARKAAKNTKNRSMLKTIGEGLELFKQDNEKRNRQTNGYPASHRAEDLASEGVQDIMGAQWLVRSLVGNDLAGFIPRRIVPPALQNLMPASDAQVRWYRPEPGDPPIDRIAPYVSLDRVDIVNRFVGISRMPPSPTWWSWCVADCADPDLQEHKIAPVFVDAFGFPILYYAANAFGKALCVSEKDDLYNGQKAYYTHEDNEGFTGTEEIGNEQGWYFRRRRAHPLYKFGPIDLDNLDKEEWAHSFANYIHDHRIDDQSGGKVLKPFNPDTHLLITAGADALYGTNDDINNFERQ